MDYIKVISLYSGAGLMDCGFINQGFGIVWGCEIEPAFIKAYNYALGKHVETLKSNGTLDSGYRLYIIPEDGVDITKVEPDTIREQVRGDFVGIIGGPPCQDYSNGGKHKGVTGEKGRLIHDYFEKVRELKPDFFVFENVDGLLRTKKHKKAYMQLIKNFNKIDYTIWHDVINALDFGIPQNRHRVFIVGFRNDVIKKLVCQGLIFKDTDELRNIDPSNKIYNRLVFRWPRKMYNHDPREFSWPLEWPFREKTKLNLTISEVFNEYGIPAIAKDLCIISAFEGLTPNTPNQAEYFNPKSYKFYQINEGDTRRKSFKRLHRFRFSPTVAYGNNEVHLHPVEPRRLTVREALRLQTAPDSFVLPSDMSLTNKFKAIGNGVPVKLVELIAAEVKRTISLYLGIQKTSLQAI
ncbi:DNA cytosine methyltransferase [Sporotomaculum syntrophicum]|nr:DNA cytosine methyltransferase [Sporotomaculum syntrophicum]